MLVLTVQEYPVLEAVYQGTYKPNFMLSSFACSSAGFSKAYLKVLSELSKKTGRSFQYGLDSCMWGWVRYPYLPLHRKNGFRRYNKRKYAVFVDIPEKDMVLTDYEEFCMYINRDAEEKDILLGNREHLLSVYTQCSFWDLDPRDIKLIVDIDELQPHKSVEELYELNKLRDSRYLFDNRVVSLMFA